jgi:hypothetical protein
MPQHFYERLASYFSKVGEVLRGESDASAVFANATDRGGARERLYCSFLQTHAPSNCNVDVGGFVFSVDGSESKQIDVIITAANVPRFKPGASDKAFACVTGVVGVASIKSHLDKKELVDALENVESVPFSGQIRFPASFQVDASVAADMPLRIIYASSGIATETLKEHLADWLVNVHAARPGAKFQRLPHIIHVAGQCVFRRQPPLLSPDGSVARIEYALDNGTNTDAVALASVVQALQNFAVVANLSLPDFVPVFDNMLKALK